MSDSMWFSTKTQKIMEILSSLQRGVDQMQHKNRRLEMLSQDGVKDVGRILKGQRRCFDR